MIKKLEDIKRKCNSYLNVISNELIHHKNEKKLTQNSIKKIQITLTKIDELLALGSEDKIATLCSNILQENRGNPENAKVLIVKTVEEKLSKCLSKERYTNINTPTVNNLAKGNNQQHSYI